MKNIWSVARRDFRSYFYSPLAYVICAGFMAIMGWMFYFNMFHFIMSQSMSFGRGQSITDGIFRPLFGNMNVILLFVIPFITMRLFAEERKLHTIELLMTAPITLTEIILGKFLSSFLLICVMLSFTLIFPIVLLIYGNPDLGPIFTNYLGILLMSGCYITVGIFFSSMTENQIVAGMLSFATALFLWLISWASQAAGAVWGDILMYLSLINHNQSMGQGVLNTADIFYYLSFMGVGLFVTHRVLDSYRWR